MIQNHYYKRMTWHGRPARGLHLPQSYLGVFLGVLASWRFILVLIALCSLTACVNQKKEIQTYRDVLDKDSPKPKPLQPGEVLTLGRALALANADNEQLASQGENYLQALINKNRVVATFLPTVSFQPSFTIQDPSKTNAGTTTVVGPNATAVAVPISPNSLAKNQGFVRDGNTWQKFSAPVVGSMNLAYNNVDNLAAANQTIEQQRQLLMDAQATILLNVAQTYYQVLLSEQQVDVLRESLKTQDARVADVQGRYTNHLALALEVSQTVAQEAATRAQLVQALSDVRNGRRTLAIIIAAPQVDGPLIDDTPVPDRLAAMEYYVNEAVKNRNDLLAAQAAVRAARASVDAAIAEYYPSVSLNVAGFLYEEYFSAASKWDAILQANLPIFSAGIIEADVRAAWSRLRQAALAESFLHRQIEQSVRNAYDNFATSGQELTYLQTEVKASSDALDQSVQLRDNGLAIPLDVLTAQDTLLNSQLQYTSESFSRTVFYLDLIRATGNLKPNTPALIHNPTTHATTAPKAVETTQPSTMPATPQ